MINNININPADLMNLWSTSSFWLVLKIGVSLLLTIYLVFAFVIVRQARMMTETLELGFEVPIKILSYLHFLFALSLLVYALVIL